MTALGMGLASLRMTMEPTPYGAGGIDNAGGSNATQSFPALLQVQLTPLDLPAAATGEQPATEREVPADIPSDSESAAAITLPPENFFAILSASAPIVPAGTPEQPLPVDSDGQPFGDRSIPVGLSGAESAPSTPQAPALSLPLGATHQVVVAPLTAAHRGTNRDFIAMQSAAPVLKAAAPSRFEQPVTATILPAKVLTPQLHGAIGSHSSTAITAAHSVAHRESVGAGTAGLAANLGEQSAMPIAEPMIAEAALPEKSSTEAAAPAPRTRTLSVTPDEQWVDQLGRDIASLATSSGTIHFRLKPEQLGQITVALDLTGDQLSVHLHSGSADISAVLQGAQTRLAEELRAQGLTLSALDIGPHQGRTGSEGSPRGGQHAQATNDQATGEPPSLPSPPTEPPDIRLA